MWFGKKRCQVTSENENPKTKGIKRNFHTLYKMVRAWSTKFRKGNHPSASVLPELSLDNPATFASPEPSSENPATSALQEPSSDLLRLHLEQQFQRVSTSQLDRSEILKHKHLRQSVIEGLVGVAIHTTFNQERTESEPNREDMDQLYGIVKLIATSKTPEDRLKDDLKAIFRFTIRLSNEFKSHGNTFQVSFPGVDTMGILHFSTVTMDGGGFNGKEVGLLIFPQLLHEGNSLVRAKVICTDEMERHMDLDYYAGCSFTWWGCNSITL
ncbi:hypothetical protein BDD12DRAFT_847459 [Trichophaea hybrida]|nr:hypothetical protein BDD12DRAFT_847459 [Trichophaea hybrida]